MVLAVKSKNWIKTKYISEYIYRTEGFYRLTSESKVISKFWTYRYLPRRWFAGPGRSSILSFQVIVNIGGSCPRLSLNIQQRLYSVSLGKVFSAIVWVPTIKFLIRNYNLCVFIMFLSNQSKTCYCYIILPNSFCNLTKTAFNCAFLHSRL